MMKQKWLVFSQMASMLLAFAVAASAQGRSTTNQGSTPNGKPFQAIQSQFDAVDQQLAALNQQIQALEAEIAAVENNLQTQINTINANVSALQTQVNSLDGAVTALTARVDADQTTIAALNAAVESLEAQLATVQGQIAANSGDIQALQGQAAYLQSLIAAHEGQIQGLTQSISQAQSFLNNLANGTCGYQQAISDIGPTGSIQCIQAGGGQSQIATASAFWWGTWGYAQCPSGYTAIGGGFYKPSLFDYVDYVSSVSNNWTSFQSYYVYSWDWYWGAYWRWTYDYGYYATANYRRYYVDPLKVTSSTPSGQAWYVQTAYQPHNFGSSPYLYAYATCLKIQ